MEEINLNESRINVKDLEGEPLDINLASIQEAEGLLGKELIHAHEEYSFDNELFKTVVDGFTEGALKDFITISEEKTRLYKVTEDSIKALSCFERPSETLRLAIQDYTVILNKQDCSIQVFHDLFYRKVPVVMLDKTHCSYILKFDFKAGELVSTEEVAFPKDPSIYRVAKQESLESSFSKTDSFVLANFAVPNSQNRGLELGRVRGERWELLAMDEGGRSFSEKSRTGDREIPSKGS